jgi:hypothetical protein
MENSIEVTKEDLYGQKENLIDYGFTPREADEIKSIVEEKVHREVEEQNKNWSEDAIDGFVNLMLHILIQQLDSDN